MGIEYINCKSGSKEEEGRRAREKKKVSDNTHIHNLQQGSVEEM